MGEGVIHIRGQKVHLKLNTKGRRGVTGNPLEMIPEGENSAKSLFFLAQQKIDEIEKKHPNLAPYQVGVLSLLEFLKEYDDFKKETKKFFEENNQNIQKMFELISKQWNAFEGSKEKEKKDGLIKKAGASEKDAFIEKAAFVEGSS